MGRASRVMLRDGNGANTLNMLKSFAAENLRSLSGGFNHPLVKLVPNRSSGGNMKYLKPPTCSGFIQRMVACASQVLQKLG